MASTSLKSASSLAKSLSRNEGNMLGLLHSALDLNPKLYDFTQWLNSPEYMSTGHLPANKAHIQAQPAISINVPIAYGDYNGVNGMGCGLKVIEGVSKGTIMIKQKTEMGFISGGGLYDSTTPAEGASGKEEDKDLEDLNQKLIGTTKRVCERLFPGNAVQQNRLFQHLMLTQKLIIYDRFEQRFGQEASSHSEFIRAYTDVLPRGDLTQLTFWPKHILTEIDSTLLIQQYRDTLGYYQYIHQQLTTDPLSPYAAVQGGTPLPLEQFLWAFSIVSSRHLILNNNENVVEDDKMQLLLMPLLDFINHTNLPNSKDSSNAGPNVVALPYHDTVNGESYVVIQAIRDIEKDEQLLMSYGRLSNSHLIQKYGFTMKSNAEYNQASLNPSFNEFQAVVGEEQKLKQAIRQRLKFSQFPSRYPFSLYQGRFNQDIIRQTRLNMLTSKQIMDTTVPDAHGHLTQSDYYQHHEDFSKPFDPENEQLSFKFLTQSLEDAFSKLKPKEYYVSRIAELEAKLDSLDKYHMLNVCRLQLDEWEILKGNLDYMYKTESANIKGLYQ